MTAPDIAVWLAWRASLPAAPAGPMLRTEYRAALAAIQQNRCAVCLTIPDSARQVVDHDHQTGYARGMLCRSCNYRVGLYESRSYDGAYLQVIKLYLADPPASGVPWMWEAPDPDPVPTDQVIAIIKGPQLGRARHLDPPWQTPPLPAGVRSDSGALFHASIQSSLHFIISLRCIAQ